VFAEIPMGRFVKGHGFSRAESRHHTRSRPAWTVRGTDFRRICLRARPQTELLRDREAKRRGVRSHPCQNRARALGEGEGIGHPRDLRSAQAVEHREGCARRSGFRDRNEFVSFNPKKTRQQIGARLACFKISVSCKFTNRFRSVQRNLRCCWINADNSLMPKY
jgi:hypothetical protein